MIPIKYESKEIINEWPKIIEACHFCKKPTRWWHVNTNNPVCVKCAKLHKVAELPDHGKSIRARKRKSNGLLFSK